MVEFVDTCYVTSPAHFGSRRHFYKKRLFPVTPCIRITSKSNDHLEDLVARNVHVTPLIKKELDKYQGLVQAEFERQENGYKTLLEEHNDWLNTLFASMTVVEPTADSEHVQQRFGEGKPSLADRELCAIAAYRGLDDPTTLYTRDRDMIDLTQQMIKHNMVPWTMFRLYWDRAWQEEIIYDDRTFFQ